MTGKVAVVVFHGMGQPVPFQALDPVVEVLKTRIAEGVKDEPKLEARVDRLGDEKLTRAEISWYTPDGKREVHLYEAYWAPLTEGRIHFWNVFWFMIDAGVRGLTYSLSHRHFGRWMFGKEQKFTVDRAATALKFIAAFLVFLSLIGINVLTFTVAAALPVLGPTVSWPGPALLRDLTIDLLVFVLCLLLAATCVLAPMQLYKGVKAKGRRFKINEPFRWCCWSGLVIAMFGTVWSAGAMVYDLLLPPPADDRPMGPLMTTVGVVTWLFAFAGSWQVRLILTQYLGDVAIYVSSHTLNQFYEVRTKIKEAALKATRAVYAHKNDGGFTYDRVVLVGHSLGSVVAYDTLNGLINEDRIGPKQPLDVVSRTPLLLTTGSPLDKTAFLFRTQRHGADVRERMAAAVQPMIEDDGLRPARWVNIFSPDDWISSSLRFYDRADKSGDRRIKNCQDPEARVPLIAHDLYGANDIFITTLHDAVK